MPDSCPHCQSNSIEVVSWNSRVQDCSCLNCGKPFTRQIPQGAPEPDPNYTPEELEAQGQERLL